MLFDELDIEKRLDSSYIQDKMFCSMLPGQFSHTNPGKNVGDAAKEHREKKAAEDKEASAKARAAEKKARWQDQCFLIEGWKAITEKFQTCERTTGKSGYDHVIPVLADSSDIVSVLSDRLNANLFFTLSPAQMSMLVPSIRLFLVKYKEQKNSSGTKTIVEDDEPLELYLDDFTDKKLVNNIMTGKKGRAEAIGLKSFTYEFDGKNPATTDTLIKANISLTMNSFERLTEVQDNGVKFLDLLLRTKKMVKNVRNDKVAKEKDNIYNYCKENEEDKASKNETDASLMLNPEYRRIRASFGWAIPSGNEFFQLFPKSLPGTGLPAFKKRVINLIESMKIHLFLEMTDYDINFRDDGRIDLSIDYRGAIEGELNQDEANIFYQLKKEVTRIKQKADDKKTKMREKQKEEEKKIKENKSADKDEQDEQKQALAKTAAQSQTALDNKTKDQVFRDKLYWYSYFLTELEKSNRVIKINVTKDALELWKGQREFARADGKKNESAEDTSAGAGGSKTADEILKEIFDGNQSETQYGKYEIVDDGVTGTGGTSPLSGNAKAVGDAADSDKDAAKKGGDAAETLEDLDKSLTSADPSHPSTRNIYFTFMGDILDTAMKFVNELNRDSMSNESTVRLMTSLLTFPDPNPDANTNNRSGTLNIADIPVSLSEFITWFHDNVIKRQVTDFPVVEFIKKAITDLAIRAFGYNCTGGAQFTPVLNYTTIELPRTAGNKEPLAPGTRYNNISPIRKIKKDLNTVLRSSPSRTINYVIINGSARDFVNRNADDIEGDERDGIYHFGIGLNRGILKDVKFSSMKLAYGPETRIVDQNVAGIRQLFRKFDADVSLYGCPIFRNGQRLFLDPRTMGVGSDVARAMGLGGYYIIYNVHGKLTRSQYITELKCNYEGSGLCGKQSVDRSVVVCGGDAQALNIPSSRTLEEQDEAAKQAVEESKDLKVPLQDKINSDPTDQRDLAAQDWQAGNAGPPALPPEPGSD